MLYVGNTHNVGKNTGRRHSGPGSVSLNLHGILLIALCRQQDNVIGTFEGVERMFTSYLTQFHTGFAVLVTGNKTPTFSFALQYLTPPLEIGIQGRQVLPKFIQRTPEKRIGHEQVLLHVGLFDTVTRTDPYKQTPWNNPTNTPK